jgi:hypothetical protein
MGRVRAKTWLASDGVIANFGTAFPAFRHAGLRANFLNVDCHVETLGPAEVDGDWGNGGYICLDRRRVIERWVQRMFLATVFFRPPLLRVRGRGNREWHRQK